jgi:cupin fold WbuC family metalloprotein
MYLTNSMASYFIEALNGKSVVREIFHEDGDLLNIMRLTLSAGPTGKPHYNRDRNEIVFVERGALKVILFDESMREISSTVIESSSYPCWHIIKMNQIHQFVALEDGAVILEVIGGEFFEGACVTIER